jgi:pSer/pThr/pTyr-binding forkhead associated (FHA) protein
MSEPEALAKLVWIDPETRRKREQVLTEGATITIGRSSNNDIAIPEQHISRQHAVITYRDGVFVISDLGSSNGTAVNDQLLTDQFPLFAGDLIKLHTTEIRFAALEAGDVEIALTTGTISLPPKDSQCCLVVTNGAQEGQTIALLLDKLTIGRATTAATWEILLQDASVSRPHARLERQGKDWFIFDLNSSNKTKVNTLLVEGDQGVALTNGDMVILGNSRLLFRVGWQHVKAGLNAEKTAQ